jgi:ribose transport system permease protein
MKSLLRSAWMPALLATIAVFIIGTITTERFFSVGNFSNLILQLSVISILSMAAGLVILTGEIDLSPGAAVSLLSMILATGIMRWDLPIGLAIGLVLVGGVGLGLVNGLLVTALRVPSFVATLGTLGIFSGVSLLFNGGSPITGLPEAFQNVFYSRFWGIPFPLFVMVVIIVVLRYFLIRTVWGRSVYAVGGNKVAATLSGLNPNRTKMLAFAIAGGLVGIAAVMFSARLATGSPNLGNGLELAAIAGAVVGGISLSGGRGHVLGALFGATTIVIVQNILNLNAVAATWQSIVQGLIIIAAVSIDSWRGNDVFKLRKWFRKS